MSDDNTQNQNQEMQKTEGEELQKKLEQCEKLRDEYLDGWKRAKADLINYKKDEMQRMGEFIKFGNRQMIEELITVLDSFDLGMAALKGNNEAIAGVRLIKNQLEDLLKRYGLEHIEIKEGDVFNPSYHEAVEEEESEKPPNSIIKELGHGYMLHGKVVRPAKVKISKGKQSEKIENRK